MQRETFIRQTVEWLNRRIAPEGVVVDADTRLFETGVVDSLGILRLIAWTEQQIGRRIADREIRMDRFGSVRVIAESFAESGVAAESFAARRACRRCGACALTGTPSCPRRAA